jgi:SAM-dependent methyltransferase
MAVMDKGNDRFSAGVGAWRAGLGKVRDAVRQELVARQLAGYLPPVTAAAPAVLDVGCGQGTQAIMLARRGYDVTGVDVSDELLDTARATASAEPGEVRGRLRFERADLLDLGARYEGRFEVVCCHGVLMYLPSLAAGVAAAVGAARPGGVLSLLTRNRAGIGMRAGMSGDWDAALAGFDARVYRNRLGLDQVRADEPAEVAAALVATGAGQLEWYGVRLFSDHWGQVEVGDDFDALVEAEYQAGRRDPYRQVCALTHTLARRFGGSVPDREDWRQR